MPATRIKSKWRKGSLVFDQDRGTGSNVQVGEWPDSATDPTNHGIELGTRWTYGGASTRRTRAFVVGANDGGHDPTDRIESSCHTFTQSCDWATGWSTTALEGVFYGGYDIINTEDGANYSGVGGWIYLDGENDVTGGAPKVGGSSGTPTYVCGVESFVALPADVNIQAVGVVCGLKLSNKFASGMTAGSGTTAAIFIETVDTSGYEFMIATNSASNGFEANTHAMTLTPTAYHMKVKIGATTYYIPVFDDHEWD
jgi:hypothetical protein